MNNFDNKKIIQMVVAIGLLCLFVGIAARIRQVSQTSLSDYAKQNPDKAYQQAGNDGDSSDKSADGSTNQSSGSSDGLSNEGTAPETPDLPHTGVYNPKDDKTLAEIDYWRNTPVTYDAIKERYHLTDDSDLCNSINECFFITSGYDSNLVESTDSGSDSGSEHSFSMDYSVINFMYYNIDHKPQKGRLVAPAEDSVSLVWNLLILYLNEYEFENVMPIDEYDCNIGKARQAGSTFFYDGKFYFNSLENPYVSNADGIFTISAVESMPYIDRTADFRLKIDESDFLYVLLISSGYGWSGSDLEHTDYGMFYK